MELRLNSDQVRIAASAINWTLNCEFYRSPRPVFRDDEIQVLNLVHGHLCFALHNNREVKISESHLSIAPEAPQERGVVHNLIRCVLAFEAEVGHSPDEIKVVTNVPISVLKSLLGDLELFGCDSA